MHDAIKDVIYAFAQESGHTVWKEWWYVFTLGVSLWTNIYMICEDHISIVDVVGTNPTREMIATNIISRPIGV